MNKPSYKALDEQGYPECPCVKCQWGGDDDVCRLCSKSECTLLQIWYERRARDKKASNLVQYMRDQGFETVEETKIAEAKKLQAFEKWLAETELKYWFELYSRGLTDGEVHRHNIEEGWKAALKWVLKNFIGSSFDEYTLTKMIEKELGE